MSGRGATMVVATLVLFITVIGTFHFVAADLPVHCLNLNVAGGWTLSLSATTDNADTSCGYDVSLLSL
jgi:hypothetical protein